MFAPALTRWLAILTLIAGLSGCASLYFEEAGRPPSPAPKYQLARWPYQDYWTGIVFNGHKIGFSHLHVAPAGDNPHRYEIRSEAAFVLKFVGVEKRFEFKTVDRVGADLTLRRFDHEYDIDGHHLRLSGAVRDDHLRVAVRTSQNATEQDIALNAPLYPSSVVTLYPVLHGLEVGRQYAYRVYDGQTQSVALVEQEVEAYERSKLFTGNAFKVHTTLQGQTTTTWIDAHGEPQLEIALRGILISGLETEAEAKRYLALAALDKKDLLLDYSLIRTDDSITHPRRTTALTVILEDLHSATLPPSGDGQQCQATDEGVLCEIHSVSAIPVPATGIPGGAPDRYLSSTLAVPSIHPRIRATARAIAGDAPEPLEAVTRIIEWIQKNIERAPVDVFSALEVLEERKAECQGHAYLYTALARALGIPTRVVNGIVYSEDAQGFLYHSWAESRIGKTWLPVDPTFGQLGADATHIKLLEGESTAELVSLVDMVGRLKARIVSFESPQEPALTP